MEASLSAVRVGRAPDLDGSLSYWTSSVKAACASTVGRTLAEVAVDASDRAGRVPSNCARSSVLPYHNIQKLRKPHTPIIVVFVGFVVRL